MCWLSQKIKPQKTVEELIAEKSVGMTDGQKAEYWYELSQNIFALLGKVDIPIVDIPAGAWIGAAQTQYPTLTNVKFADSVFYTTDIESLQKILTLDWTNLVPYVAEISDCDKFATRLYNHLVDYYKVSAIIPVWGNTDAGYHGFNLAVVRQGAVLIARLIEPQGDQIFVEQGPLGRYIPRETAVEFGIKRLKT